MLDGFATDLVRMDAPAFGSLLLFTLGGGSYLLYLAFGRLRWLQVITHMPTSRVRSAAQGYVELAGIARALEGPPIIAPLTATPCTWYSYKVEERSGSGKNQRWQVVDRGTSEDLFSLVDDTGMVVVDPEGARVLHGVRQVWYGNQRLGGRGPRNGLFAIGARYRFEERRISDGDPLFAIGHFQTQRAAATSQRREDISDLLRAWKVDRSELLRRFDANGDGEIDLAEWETARREAERMVTARHREAASASGHDLLSRPPGRLPFLLAARDEAATVRHARLTFGAALVPGTLAFAFGLWCASIRLFA